MPSPVWKKTNNMKPNQWKNHYEALLTEIRPQFDDMEYITETIINMERHGRRNLKSTLKNMKNNKSPRPECLSIELANAHLKHFCSFALHFVQGIYKIYCQECKITFFKSIYK